MKTTKPTTTATSNTTSPTKPDSLYIFEFHGVELSDKPNRSGQYVGDCPLCDASQHFFVSEKSKNPKIKSEGPFFVCVKCGEKGNKYTFLKQLYIHMHTKTLANSLQRLSLKRKKFQVKAFTAAKIAYNPITHRWLIPTFNISGGVTNLHTYDGKPGSPLIGTPGCAQHLYGLEGLKKDGPVMICEGHWDAISIKHLLSNCQEQSEKWSVLAAPGCTTFPESDLKHLQGRDLYFPFDNDEPGHKGMLQCIAKATGHAKTLHAIDWPPNRFADGYDLTDLVRESKIRADQTFAELLTWHHQAATDGKASVTEAPLPKLDRTKIEEVIADFKETGVHVYPGFRDALVITLAVSESIFFGGEPLWAYLIGVSGSGKSLILDSTLAAEGILYRTAITHRSLISGYKGEEGVDPSLLAKLPGRCLIVKDYSNVLSLPAYEQDQLFSLLREAYDGRVYRDYGNGVIRQYPPAGSEHDDCKFSFVAGVTPDIYTKDNTALGERFLRFHIPRTAGDDLRAIETAMDDSWRSHQRARRRAASVAAFLGRYDGIDKEELPKPNMPQWYRARIIALSQFVGYCRSHVARTGEDLDYDPAVESGTRMSKQLKKLSLSIARVMGKNSCDQDVYRLVRKVAWDTAHGKRRALYMRFRKHGEGEAVVLARTTGYAISTVHRQLRDMHALGMLKKAGTKVPTPEAGRPRVLYELTDKAKEIFDTAKIKEV